MNYSKTTVMGEQQNILANTHYTAISKKVAKSIASSGVIKAGTIINADGTVLANGAGAEAITKPVLGIVLYDINVSNEAGNNVVIPVLTHGTIVEKIAKELSGGVSYSADVKAKLPQILFV
jgi:hypothetical protein|nr:MAG TPA: Head decoration protein [Caudoviricetes sp.]